MTDQMRALAGGMPAPADAGRSAAANDPFVINLSSSTTPLALEQPKSPELARFTFFVSRRREEGRERFRLHMGYFETAAEAEEWLVVVRDVYPAAWVGEAPGKRLRGAQAGSRKPVASSGTVSEPLQAGEAQNPAPPPAPLVVATEPASTPEAAPAAPAAPEATRDVPTLKPVGAAQQSNVREVLAQLSDDPIPTEPAPDVLSDTQVLKLLEKGTGAAPASGKTARPADARAAEAVSMLRPDDTQTMRALRAEVARNVQVSFAVQLHWSVQPIELDKVPPLAIFSAYTLYTVEGSREGRRWYGLRLGFFSDAISAKQVAGYVRSEFASVAVIPVTANERERAGNRKSASRPRPASATVKPPKPPTDEFKLLDDTAAQRTPLAADPAPEVQPEAVDDVDTAPAEVPGRRRRGARPQAAPRTLDETLEILGAGELEIDRSHTLLNDSGVRHIRIQADNRPPSAFSRLLDRLTDRLRQN
ncbi:MAG: hypothetical protein IPI06_13860 [Gammaproteobacteria bacterium]|nr:hypothetical protein [Gammaproteobacteria bacterium]